MPVFVVESLLLMVSQEFVLSAVSVGELFVSELGNLGGSEFVGVVTLEFGLELVLDCFSC